jgi:hypothetical protein
MSVSDGRFVRASDCDARCDRSAIFAEQGPQWLHFGRDSVARVWDFHVASLPRRPGLMRLDMEWLCLAVPFKILSVRLNVAASTCVI